MVADTALVRRIRTRRSRASAVLGSALIAMTLATGAASATIIERTRFVEPYQFDNWDCGYEMHIEGDQSGLVHLRLDKKLDDTAYFSLNYEFSERWTAPDGRWFTLSGNGAFKDIRAKSRGSLFQFTFHETGQPRVLTDSWGNLVSRDRGSIAGTYTFDSATGSENLDFRVSGPHALFDADLCEVVQPLTGGDSDGYLTPRPIGSTDSPTGYYEYLPPSYSAAGAASPLLLFFHGYGETGDGNPETLSNLLFAGIPRYINVGGWSTDRPFVVLSPQHVEGAPGFDFSSCAGVPWEGSCNMQVQHDLDNAQPAFCTTPDEVHDFIAFAVAHYNVDPAQVYLTGLSCGAFGIWEYLAKYHDSQHVAAAVPIAGDGRPGSASDYCALDSTPLWAFHGDLDDLVDPLGSIEPMTALAACPGVPADEAKLTVYPDRDHNSWDPAYGGADDEDIYSWMLGFSNP